MSKPIIEVLNISKKYAIGKKESYGSLREEIMQTISSPFRRLFSSNGVGSAKPENNSDSIWALKDVSFKVDQGEVLGIVGKNGAGKSTLLKILSRITKPTSGRIIIHGRVASLLEVGTGFHSELTGRENIYLNGSLLGMSNKEIKAKFDEIVEFSEIEKFLDTPVKRYSSGMYVRLAFAVAAHLEPEILIVDEVLAVGDAEFQKKCLGKMDDAAKSGRTVLFVSHNMEAIQRLCSRAILIESGGIAIDADSTETIRYYLRNISKELRNDVLLNMTREKTDYGKVLRVSKVSIWASDDNQASMLGIGETFSILVEFLCLEDVSNFSVILGIDTTLGVQLTTVASEEVGQFFTVKKDDVIRIRIRFDNIVLNKGKFIIRVGARKGNMPLDLLRQALLFEVTECRDPKARQFLDFSGLIRSTAAWKIVSLKNTIISNEK